MLKGKESKYELILEVAFKLFLDKGYSNTKIIDIAQEAGIGKGTVYEYFKSKESLVCEIFKTKVIPIYTQIDTVIQDGMTCQEKLQAIINFELDTVSQFGNNKNILSYFVLKSDFLQNKELINAMQELMDIKFKSVYNIISEGIRNGEFINVDPLMATLSITGALNYYISFGYDFIKPFGDLGKDKSTPWDSNEFLNLIFNGLKV